MVLLFGCSANDDYSSFLKDDNKDSRIAMVFEEYKANGGTLDYDSWLSSIKGEQGPKGDKGEQGPKGDTGEPGPKGDKGEIGSNGKDGSSLLTGNGTPSDNLGNDGDSYVDLNCFDYYVKKESKWEYAGNIHGDSKEPVPFAVLLAGLEEPKIIEKDVEVTFCIDSKAPYFLSLPGKDNQLIFSSSDTMVLTIDSFGIIQFVNEGDANVTITNQSGYSLNVLFHIKKPTLTIIPEKQSYEVKVGQTIDVSFDVFCDGKYEVDDSLNFSIANQDDENPVCSIESIDSKMVSLKGLGIGEATLVVTAKENPACSISIPISVTESLLSLQEVWNNISTLNNYTLNISRAIGEEGKSLPYKRILINEKAIIGQKVYSNEEDEKPIYGPLYLNKSTALLGLGVNNANHFGWLTRTNDKLNLGDSLKTSDYDYISKDKIAGWGNEASSPDDIYVYGGEALGGLQVVNPSWFSSLKKENSDKYRISEHSNSIELAYVTCALWKIVDYSSYCAISKKYSPSFLNIASFATATIDVIGNSKVSISIHPKNDDDYIYTIEMSDVSTTQIDSSFEDYLDHFKSSDPYESGWSRIVVNDMLKHLDDGVILPYVSRLGECTSKWVRTDYDYGKLVIYSKSPYSDALLAEIKGVYEEDGWNVDCTKGFSAEKESLHLKFEMKKDDSSNTGTIMEITYDEPYVAESHYQDYYISELVIDDAIYVKVPCLNLGTKNVDCQLSEDGSSIKFRGGKWNDAVLVDSYQDLAKSGYAVDIVDGEKVVASRTLYDGYKITIIVYENNEFIPTIQMDFLCELDSDLS